MIQALISAEGEKPEQARRIAVIHPLDFSLLATIYNERDGTYRCHGVQVEMALDVELTTVLWKTRDTLQEIELV